jgi:enoyl-CoA hydratase
MTTHSSPSLVTLEVMDGVGVVTLHAAERRNALDGALAIEFIACLEAASNDSSIGAVVIAADGPSFCSGGDLDLLYRAGGDPTAPAAFEELGQIYRMFATMSAMPMPLIAAAQGAMVGAGLNLALAADLVVAADDLEIRGFGRSGLHPGGGHLSLLAQKAPAAAAAVALLGQKLDAADALRTGLVWQVVPRVDLLPTALAIARRAASDAELTRAVTATYRAATSARLSYPASILLERAPQMWSLRRAVLRRTKEADDNN